MEERLVGQCPGGSPTPRSVELTTSIGGLAMAESKGKKRPSPLDAIKEDQKEAESRGQQFGVLEAKPCNQWIEENRMRPDPVSFCDGLVVEGENTVAFARSNIGKSIKCTQMAAEIALHHKVLYIDCELSGKQFQMRYTNKQTGSVHVFPENFLRAEIDPDLIVESNLEEAILNSIRQAAISGIRYFFVDNITFLCNDSEKGQTAGEFMMKLIKLKKKYHLTLVIIAHTPKRDCKLPITQNDLAGSAKLINFFDAGFAIGESAKDKDLRYIKQVKVRTGKFLYPSDHVMLYRIENPDNFTQFVFQGYGDEREHLRERNATTDMEDMQEVVNFKSKGLSVRQIAEETGLKPTTVFRKLKKAEKMGIKPVEIIHVGSSEEPVCSAELEEHEEQSGTASRLPFKDDD